MGCLCSVCSGIACLASCCGSSNDKGCGPTSAKLGFVALIVMSVFLAVIFRTYGIDSLKDYYAFEDACTQDQCLENSVVYRFSFLNVIFFAVMAVFTPGCEFLHLKMWQIKLPLYFIMMAGTFFMKNSAFNDYEDVARVFSIVFLFLQVILLLDFSFELDHALITKANKADEDRGLDPEDGCCGYFKNWIRLLYLAILLSTWAATVGFWIAMYDQFDCPFAQGMTSMVLCVTIILQVVGNVAGEFLASQSEDGQGGGMIPCAVGGLYATWLTFSALSSNPDAECNPFKQTNDNTSIWFGVIFSAVSIGYMGYSFSNNVFSALGCCQKGGCCQECGDQFCYEEENNNSSSPTRRLSNSNDDMHKAAAGDVEASKDDDAGDESNGFSSNSGERQLSETGKCGKRGAQRLVFHVTMCTCGFYMAMVLTNWAKNPTNNDWDPATTDLSTSDESMWIKLGSMFMTIALYFWIIAAPFLFPNRDFGSAAQ